MIGKLHTVKNAFINLVKSQYIYIIGVVLFTYKAIILNVLLGMNIGKEMYFITAAVPMLILLPCISKNKKFSIIYLNIMYSIATLFIFANYIYYQYSNNFLSLYQIENLEYGKEIGAGLDFLIKFKSIVFFWLDNFIIILISTILQKKVTRQEKKSKLLKIVFCIIVLLFNIIVISSKVDRTAKYYIYNKTLMVEHISIYYYHMEDAKEYIGESIFKEKVDYANLEEIYNTVKKDKQEWTEYTGVSSNNNVIILQLESLNEFIINKTINGEEITPNINKFFKENIYCSEMYNQGLGTTADSEHTTLNSMFPLENGRVFQKYYNNKWFDLFSQLEDNGYYTSFMHPNVSDFWNRYHMYSLGYKVNEYNDISKFDSNGEMAGEFFSDEQFFSQSVEKTAEYKEPFCTMLVSVTTHIPYSLEGINNLEDKINLDVSNIEDEETRNYLLSCNFVDYSFGRFLEELEKSGLDENTILIVYGDHGAGLQNEETLSLIFSENGAKYNENIEKLKDTHIPFGMRVPEISDKINIVTAKEKMDIKPTILDLLGIRDKFSLGESIFTSKDYAFIKGIGFVTKDEYYIDEKFINRNTNEEIEPDENLIYLTNKMNDEMILSDTIIKNNLIQKMSSYSSRSN